MRSRDALYDVDLFFFLGGVSLSLLTMPHIHLAAATTALALAFRGIAVLTLSQPHLVPPPLAQYAVPAAFAAYVLGWLKVDHDLKHSKVVAVKAVTHRTTPDGEPLTRAQRKKRRAGGEVRKVSKEVLIRREGEVGPCDWALADSRMRCTLWIDRLITCLILPVPLWSWVSLRPTAHETEWHCWPTSSCSFLLLTTFGRPRSSWVTRISLTLGKLASTSH